MQFQSKARKSDQGAERRQWSFPYQVLHSFFAPDKSEVHTSMYATRSWFSSLAPFEQGDKGLPPTLLISIMEQPCSSINALVLTLSRLAESCLFKWLGYKPRHYQFYYCAK